MANNSNVNNKEVTFDRWLSLCPMLKKGFLDYYECTPFDPEINSSAYEVGRQMAVVAKYSGHKTKGKLIRRRPNSQEYDWVKTKSKELEYIVRDLGYTGNSLAIRNFGA